MVTPTGVVVLTDRRMAGRPLETVVGAAVAGGARWVVLRERDMPRPARAELASALRALLAPVGGRLIVAGSDPLDGDAVHLPAAAPDPPAGVSLVGRSCHDADELARVSTEDYVTVSPVFPTATKPGYGPALGPARAGALATGAGVPWLALGGVDSPERAAACVAAGAAGVAVLGSVMRAADPETTVRGLAHELGAPR